MEPDPHDDPAHEPLIAQLRTLGRTAAVPPVRPDLTGAVLTRLAQTPAPVAAHRWRWPTTDLGRRRRSVLVAVVLVALALLGVPGVRAAVVDLFTFHGVSVRIDPAPQPRATTPAPPPTADGGSTLEGARALVTFRPLILPALGDPAAVEVSADRRLLSLSWIDPQGRAVRLDQFDGRLDYAFAKTAPDVEWVTVGDSSALWFEKPHEVAVLDAAGNSRTETARLSGHTLIWEDGGTVLRLEGDLSRERAVEIAGTAEPLP